MKYLKRIFESNDVPEKIQDVFLGISDVFGHEPISYIHDMSTPTQPDKKGYTFIWSTAIKLDQYKRAQEFYKDMKRLWDIQHELLSAEGRLSEFLINVRMGNDGSTLHVNLSPKGLENNYSFIKEFREVGSVLYLEKKSFEEFFRMGDNVPTLVGISFNERNPRHPAAGLQRGYLLRFDIRSYEHLDIFRNLEKKFLLLLDNEQDKRGISPRFDFELESIQGLYGLRIKRSTPFKIVLA